MSDKFLQAVIKRRSIYNLGNSLPMDNKVLTRLLEEAVKNAPSAFNSQSARIVLLLGKNHQRLWEITKTELQKIVPAEKFKPTAEKIASFAQAYGTVLYFEDEDTVRELQNSFSAYKDNFPLWSLQSSGMLQYIIWTLFAEHGIGASLQHYNPLIDEAVKTEWQLPAQWKLIAQMPFGNIEAPAGEKSFLPLSERIKIFG